MKAAFQPGLLKTSGSFPPTYCSTQRPSCAYAQRGWQLARQASLGMHAAPPPAGAGVG